MPQWAYGFWQSRERYKTQDEIVGILAEFRRRQIPIDNIVQDWFYWEEDQWGSHEFDATRFPDPKKMMDDIDRMNAHVMISVWPFNFTRRPNTLRSLTNRVGYTSRPSKTASGTGSARDTWVRSMMPIRQVPGNCSGSK